MVRRGIVLHLGLWGVLTTIVFLVGAQGPPRIDEIYYQDIACAFSRADWWRAEPPTTPSGFVYAAPHNYEHPPLSKLLLAPVCLVSGDLATMRLYVAGFSGMTLLSVFLIARHLGDVKGAVATAAVLIVSDFFMLRGGTVSLDPFMQAFGFLGCWFAISRPQQPWIAGLLVGLAAACKVPGLFFVGPVLYALVKERALVLRAPKARFALATAAPYLGAWAFFVPFWIQRFGVTEGLSHFFIAHVHMVIHQTLLVAAVGRPAWTWFLQPDNQFDLPWTPWPWLLCLGLLAWWYYRGRQTAAAGLSLPSFALVGFASMYAPFLLLTRDGFVYYVQPALPFLAFSICFVTNTRGLRTHRANAAPTDDAA